MAGWHEIQIGKFPAKIKSFTFKRNSFPDCTPEGIKLVKIRGVKQPDKWITENKEEYEGDRMKLVTLADGTEKPMAGFNMTRIIKNTEEKQLAEEVVGSEKSFWVDCPLMEEEIKKTGKAIAFRGYFAAKGLNALVGIIKPTAWNGSPILMMKAGKKFLSEMEQEEVSKAKGDLKSEPTQEDIAALATL